MGAVASRAAPAAACAAKAVLPAMAGAAAMTWLPAVQCAPSMDAALADVDADLEEEGEGWEGGIEILDYAEMAAEKTISVNHTEGLTAIVSVPFTRLEDLDAVATTRPNFLLQHLMMLGGPNGSQLQSTIINQLDEKHAITLTAISHGPGTLMFLPNISYPILDGVTAKYQCFFANTSGTPGIDAGQLSLSTKGSDYALEATATRGDRMGGDAFKVTYFQSVARALALGGTLNMQVAKGSWAAPEAVSWGLNGAWQSADMSHAVLGEYDSAQNEVMAAYHRQVTEKLRMSAKWTRSEAQGDVVSFAATQPLRIERMLGNAPYTTVTGQVDVHGLAASLSAKPHAIIKASVDHMTLQGMGAFALSATFDAHRKEYSFGTQFRLSA